MAAFLGAILFLSPVLAASNCSIPPIFVDIHNRAVDGGVTFQYGLFTGISSPTSQNLSQWPSFQNETTVGNLDYCTNSPFKDCITQSHGFYSPELSQTYSSNSSYQSLDELGPVPATFAGTAFDTFNIFTHYFDPSPPNVTHLTDFPIAVFSNYSSSSTTWFGPAGLVGLGPSSTLLQRLYHQGLIATRSFGLYVGTTYEPANGAVNGSLTLGGYDSGRFEGAVYSYTISPAAAEAEANHSPFKVSVAQLTLTASDGTQTDLLNSSFDAYITTSQYQLNLPDTVTRKFADTAGATVADGAGVNPVLQLPHDFDSTLTISLKGGLSITYDAAWLRNVSNNSPISAGSLASSSSANTVNGTADVGVGILGSAFLSYIYLIANYDANPPAFHLASARQNGPYVLTQPLCADTVPVAAKATKIPSFARAGLTGAIIGGVVGGIGLTFLGYCLFRKWLQSRLQRRQQSAMNSKGFGGGKGKSPSDRDSESSEMTTFDVDFKSHASQHYQNYLSQNRGPTQPGQPQQQEPQPQPQSQQYPSNDNDRRYASQTRAEEYLRTRDDAYTISGPLTPATGVPLLNPQNDVRQSESEPTTTYFPSSITGSRSQTPTSQLFLQPGTGTSLSPRRKSNESAQRSILGLNLKTEFDPPPGRSPIGATRKRAGGKKESLLKRVFPPPSGL